METLRSLFLAIGFWTYLLVFFDLFLESSAFLGIILPGDTVAILMGVLAGGGIYSFWISLVLIIVGVFLGDITGYLLGKYKGDAILKKSPWVKHHYDATHKRIINYKERFGAWIILVGRFLPVIRAFTPFAMGIARMNFGKLLGVALITSVLWGAAWFFLGWFFGHNWKALESILKPVGFGVAGAYVIVIIGAFAWHHRGEIRSFWRRMRKPMKERVS
jgi:undecaprenyl-diphosphatase